MRSGTMLATVVCAGLAIGVSGAAAEDVRETVGFESVQSLPVLEAGPVSVVLKGGYLLGRITWTGVVDPLKADTFGSELRVDITFEGETETVVLGRGGVFDDGTVFEGETDAFAGLDPAGVWAFTFFDNVDDGATGQADAEWSSISFAFDADPGPRATLLADLAVGTLVRDQIAPGDTSLSSDDLDGPRAESGLEPDPTRFYPGGDDVYEIEWDGGRMKLTLEWLDDGGRDLDIFLFDSPDPGAGPIGAATGFASPQTLTTEPLAAGTYYVVVDGFAETGGTSYNLTLAADCPADFAPPFGVLDIFDVLAFLEAFDAEEPEADLAPPFGTFDIFDVLAFLALFEEGCP